MSYVSEVCLSRRFGACIERCSFDMEDKGLSLAFKKLGDELEMCALSAVRNDCDELPSVFRAADVATYAILAALSLALCSFL